MPRKTKILFVEDDADFGFVLKQYLEYAEFEVCLFSDPLQLKVNSELHQYDLAILDVMMPNISGFSLARQLLEIIPDLPIIFLTAKDQKIDKLTGLKIGADDYMTKPCDPEELVLRIQNILRRSLQMAVQPDVIQLGQYRFDTGKLILTHPRESIQLTEKEAELLLYLVKHKEQLINREQILRHVWGNDDFFSGRSMDVFISRLRKYLQHDEQLSIQSIRGVGFNVQLG